MCDDFTFALVKKHEGWRNSVYTDTKGIKTIGVGFNLQAAGAEAAIAHVGADYAAVVAGAETLTSDQIQILYNRSLLTAEAQAYLALPQGKFASLPPRAKSVVIDMLYNMGLTTFREFKNFIAALSQFDYGAAATAMEASLWFREVGVRGTEDRDLILSCVPAKV